MEINNVITRSELTIAILSTIDTHFQSLLNRFQVTLTLIVDHRPTIVTFIEMQLRQRSRRHGPDRRSRR
jgi:hypothetical protein